MEMSQLDGNLYHMIQLLLREKYVAIFKKLYLV